jgi:heat shock protein HslJ
LRIVLCLLALFALSAAAIADEPKPDAPLANTYWKLVTAGGSPVKVSERQREAHVIFRLDGTLGGSTGCNRMSGTYMAKGHSLKLGPIAATRMFCAETADTERAFTAALGAATGWRIRGDDLTLLNAAGEAVATLVAVYL